MPGTRVRILREIQDWIADFKAPKIFWLTGLAGMGKSAIAWTICSLIHSNLEIIFGGSCFCSRSTGVNAQRDVRCIVPTLAQLLARQSFAFSEALAAELALDPDFVHYQVAAQVERLLIKPLLALKDSLVPIVFVIDALDECGGQLTNNGASNDAESHRIVSAMLEALVAFSRSSSNLPVKFLLTSRPETHIRDTSVSDVVLNKVLRLHNVDKQQVSADIQLYISNRLFSTPTLRSNFNHQDVESLVRLSDGLFIAAATAVEYTLGEGTDVAGERFKTLLNASHNGLATGAAASLDFMYGFIIEDATRSMMERIERLQHLQQALGVLLSAQMTLSVAALADLLSVQKSQLRACLSRLHAVVHVPEDDDSANLRTIHASFGDYLLSRAPECIRIPESLGHRALAHACLHVMETDLHFNISQSRSSYELSTKPRSITLSLEYACLHWIYHVSHLSEPPRPNRNIGKGTLQRFLLRSQRGSKTEQPSEFERKISGVFCPRFLFWLEVMSVLRQVRRATAMLTFAAVSVSDLHLRLTITTHICIKVQSTELMRFFKNANSFVASSERAIEWSAPHIYISALPLAMKTSLIHKTFAPLCTGLLMVDTLGVGHHGGRLVMMLVGHENNVNSVVYSPDGLRLASGSEDGSVRIWDMRTGEEVMSPLRSDCGRVLCVSFAPSGIRVASGTSSGVVCVWSLLEGHAILSRLIGHTGAVRSVAFSPTRPLLASASKDHSVCLWSSTTCQQLRVLKGHMGVVDAVAFSPNGDVLVSGSRDRTSRLWHGATGEPVHQPRDHEGPISSICFLPDGESIAVALDTAIVIYYVQSGKERTRLHGSESCWGIQCSVDGRSLIAVRVDEVRIWTLQKNMTKVPSVALDGFSYLALSVAFSPNGLHIASSFLWPIIRICTAESSRTMIQQLPGHENDVNPLAVSRDGAIVVSGSEDHSVCVWTALSSKPQLRALLGHTGPVWSVSLSSDARLIASASWDSTVRLWNARTGKPVGQPIRDHTDKVNAVAFSLDMQWLASGSTDHTVRIWDVLNKHPSDISPLHCGNEVYSVAFSPSADLIAAGDRKGCISIWDSQTGHAVREMLQVPDLSMYSIGFSPDGTCITSPGIDDSACVWNVSTGRQLLSLKGHSSYVSSTTYSPDGRLICTGSDDETVRLWNAVTGSLVATLLGHAGRVESVTFTPDGRFIVSGSCDNSIRVWDINTAQQISSSNNDDLVAALTAYNFDGEWLSSQSGERLLWVPREYHDYLQLPHCQIKIQRSNVAIKVGNSGWHHGENWTSCWRQGQTAPILRTA